MKRNALFILITIIITCLLFCFVACGHEHQLVHHQAVAEGCMTAGNSEYWSCECGKYFADNKGENEIAKDTWIIPALEHNYGDVLYVWSADNSACKATRICATDSSHVESEVAVITSEVTQQATSALPEITTFTAVFSNDYFETQKIAIQTAPCLEPAQTDPGEWKK